MRHIWLMCRTIGSKRRSYPKRRRHMTLDTATYRRNMSAQEARSATDEPHAATHARRHATSAARGSGGRRPIQCGSSSSTRCRRVHDRPPSSGRCSRPAGTHLLGRLEGSQGSLRRGAGRKRPHRPLRSDPTPAGYCSRRDAKGTLRSSRAPGSGWAPCTRTRERQRGDVSKVPRWAGRSDTRDR
jgi:hypothetical protein